MFKKTMALAAILILALAAVSAAAYPQGQNSIRTSAFVESNLIAHGFGGEVEYQYFPWQNHGFVLGSRAFEYFAISNENGIGKLHPMVMPYLAYKYKNFEIGGGAGFNLSNAQPDITPYARMNWDIFFGDKESSSKFGMSIGTNWYFDALIIEDMDLSDAGIAAPFAAIGVAIVEVIANIIPKVNVGFTYQYDI